MEMTPDMAEAGMSLSRMANWNQTVEDWNFLLARGSGIGFRTPEGVLVASMVTLPIGPQHGWISMVLTDPAWRRCGLAKQLMQMGMDSLQSSGLTATLDATPEGEKVYQSIGFNPGPELARWKVEGKVDASAATSPAIRPIKMGDLDKVALWDRDFSGCDRRNILAHLLSSQPDLALAEMTPEGKISGYIMGRAGTRFPQLGPLVALETDTARRLLAAAMSRIPGPFYVDAFTCHQPHLANIPGIVWTKERPFTRMVLGEGNSPGRADKLFLAAGPELG
jgi:GNAT superfamily N-acetyltransferase